MQVPEYTLKPTKLTTTTTNKGAKAWCYGLGIYNNLIPYFTTTEYRYLNIFSATI